MPQPYWDDLRCKLLEAYEAGTGTLRVLAQQFRVSFGYSKKIRRPQLQTGQQERPQASHPGPVSRLNEAVRGRLRSWLQEQPDLTESELRERLQTMGVSVCKSRGDKCCAKWGCGRKKNRFTRKSATPRRTSNGVKSSPKNSARSRRNG
jgi:transposase